MRNNNSFKIQKTHPIIQQNEEAKKIAQSGSSRGHSWMWIQIDQLPDWAATLHLEKVQIQSQKERNKLPSANYLDECLEDLINLSSKVDNWLTHEGFHVVQQVNSKNRVAPYLPK